jgi:trehalose 6-phosphate synthase
VTLTLRPVVRATQSVDCLVSNTPSKSVPLTSTAITIAHPSYPAMSALRTSDAPGFEGYYRRTDVVSCELSVKALVVAANRLPVEVSADGHLHPSPGGLASALSSVTASGTHWVGWAGPEAGRPKPFDHGDLRLHPVALSAEDIERYYLGFSNAILWPLFHGRLRRVELNRAWWHSYRIVNRRFASEVCRIAPQGGTVWVHDYHLLLAPAIIRAKRPDLRIGLFLHIPFPNAQLFSMLPWRKEVIRGMLGADVLGFQVLEDVDNFVAAAERHVGARVRDNILFDGVHTVDVDAFPISIDFAHWNSLGDNADAQGSLHRKELGVESVFLGIDRLDYTKGISQRLKAFGELLDGRRRGEMRCAGGGAEPIGCGGLRGRARKWNP